MINAVFHRLEVFLERSYTRYEKVVDYFDKLKLRSEEVFKLRQHLAVFRYNRMEVVQGVETKSEDNNFSDAIEQFVQDNDRFLHKINSFNNVVKGEVVLK